MCSNCFPNAILHTLLGTQLYYNLLECCAHMRRKLLPSNTAVIGTFIVLHYSIEALEW